MAEFKVGDKVRLVKKSNATVGFKIGNECEIFSNDMGDIYPYGIKKGAHIGFVNEEHIELVEPTITSKIKIDSSGIIIKKKEGNDMLESLNLVDLYASKQKEKIENETKEKIEKLKENNEIINKFNELAEKFQKDCDELYLSQFTEEEKKEMLVNQVFDDSDMPLTRNNSYVADCCINLDFKPSGYCNLMDERSKELDKINELVKTVKAHVSIAKNKEEVEEILTRYGILDGKGRLKGE